MTADRSRDLNWIHRCNMLLLALLGAASFYLERVEVTSGLLIGGLISIINFRAISRIVVSAVRGEGNQAAVAAKLMFKLLALMAIVAAVLIWAPVDAIAFVIGISLTFVSVGLSGMVSMFRPAANPESSDA